MTTRLDRVSVPESARIDSRFPTDFLWGVVTSPYQIGGAAFEDGRMAYIWDTFSRVPGAVLGGHNGDIACAHYHRMHEDVDLVAGLGVAPTASRCPGPESSPAAGARRTGVAWTSTIAWWTDCWDAVRCLGPPCVRLGREYPAVPLYVTENGAAFDDAAPDQDGLVHDADRAAYFREYLDAVADARADAADVRGYFACSLLDNFEWGYGYGKRFGIVHVDYGTQVSIVKQSGRWFSDAISGNRKG